MATEQENVAAKKFAAAMRRGQIPERHHSMLLGAFREGYRAALAEMPSADMLAALRSVVGVFEGHEDVPIYVHKARAAIQKAKGGS